MLMLLFTKYPLFRLLCYTTATEKDQQLLIVVSMTNPLFGSSR